MSYVDLWVEFVHLSIPRYPFHGDLFCYLTQLERDESLFEMEVKQTPQQQICAISLS